MAVEAFNGEKEAFVKQGRSEYTIDYYTDKTPKQARKTIVELLKSKNLMVALQPLKAEEIAEMIDGDVPSTLSAAAVMDGMVWANCYVDETENTHEIVNGHYVAFDTVTGRAVTGINPNWDTDEYRIAGVAWKSFEGPGWSKIPIILGPKEDAKQTGLTMLRLEEDMCGWDDDGYEARIFNCSTALTEPGPIVRVMDYFETSFSRGDPAPNGDEGGDPACGSGSNANLIVAYQCGTDEEGTPIYIYVNGGTYYKRIHGFLPGNTWVINASDVEDGYEGGGCEDIDDFIPDFVYGMHDSNQITLMPRCELEPIQGAEFWAEYNGCNGYEIYNYCCPPFEEEDTEEE